MAVRTVGVPSLSVTSTPHEPVTRTQPMTIELQLRNEHGEIVRRLEEAEVEALMDVLEYAYGVSEKHSVHNVQRASRSLIEQLEGPIERWSEA